MAPPASKTPGKRRGRRALVLSALTVPCLVWGIVCASTPGAQVLASGPVPHVTVLDRGGALLGVVRTSDHKLHAPVTYEELGPFAEACLLAAEDKRYRWHPGIDPIAIGRALFQSALSGRVVSGASTLTQQVARTLFDRPQGLWGKLQEAALALKLTARWSKQELLVAYMNRVEFGPNIVGIGAASRHYFGAPVSTLSLSQVASLVAIPRGPSLYDPQRRAKLVLRRRDRILRRLQQSGQAPAALATRALRLPLKLRTEPVWAGAHHWVRRVARRAAAQNLAVVRTTLDARLQRAAESLVSEHAARLEDVDGDGAAALVVDNRSREVLAYVGSPSYLGHSAGQTDAALAKRQPGSTLKPFVYAAAMEELGYTAATLLFDVERSFETSSGRYVPANYDRRFHGPLRLREALANSRNVPAVETAVRVGPARVLSRLRSFGFDSLTESAEHYGPALALGDGEVTLEALAGAYVALASGGLWADLRWDLEGTPPAETRVLAADVAALVTDILADGEARRAAFGLVGPLDFDFDVAAKTGTSKGHRDNWTVGYSSEVTVAVWVGNFDGSPLRGASGITGAAPLFQQLMGAAMVGQKARPLRLSAGGTAGLIRAEICPLSGKLVGPACPQTRTEWFIPHTVPTARDDWHQHIWVDEVGRLSREGCPHARQALVELYPPELIAWAQHNQRPLPPTRLSPDCAPRSGATEVDAPVILRPEPDAVYLFHSEVTSERQQLVIAIGSQSPSVTLRLNAMPLAVTTPPHRFAWPLRPGSFELEVQDDAGRRARVNFVVRGAH